MITAEIINRTLDVDYQAIYDQSRALYDLLLPAKTIHITTAIGTDLYIERRDMQITHGSGGIFNYASAFGNLPEGEVSIGPGYAYGSYVVDASLPCFGKMDAPLQCTVKDTHVIEINGKRARELRAILDAVGPDAYRLAELGIGTHPTAQVTGIVLEDEKVLGTCHIAVGNNMSFGGTNDVPLHLDGVIMHPTIYADETLIMENGRPLF
jgi:leucyl aminopeptidase (aminopeptidase T)